jgi:hypothetical protein
MFHCCTVQIAMVLCMCTCMLLCASMYVCYVGACVDALLIVYVFNQRRQTPSICSGFASSCAENHGFDAEILLAATWHKQQNTHRDPSLCSFTYAYECVHVHVNAYMNIHVHVHTHIHVFLLSMYVCMCSCLGFCEATSKGIQAFLFIHVCA